MKLLFDFLLSDYDSVHINDSEYTCTLKTIFYFCCSVRKKNDPKFYF